MARNEQLIRQHKVLQVLERVRFGKTLSELRDDVMDDLGLSSLSERTLRRDLEALQAAGFDVDSHDSQRGKIWKLGPRAKSTHKISATATELIALSLGRDLLHPLAGTPFWMGIESFWNKIRDEIPAPVLSHYEKFNRTLHVIGVPAKSYEKHQGMIKTINRAILEHRIVEIDYEKPGERKKMRRIEPYAVFLFQSSLYVVAAACEISPDDETDRVRTWKLDRFRKATILDEWFQVPDDLDLDQYIGSSMGIFVGKKPRNFKIKLSAQAGGWAIEDPWHPEQKVRKLKDGGFELTVKAANELDIIPRVLQWAGEAEILSPKDTREAIAQIIDNMAKAYR